MNTPNDEKDLLARLSEGEDDFDVDLMACGCRLAAGGKLVLSVDDLVRLFNLEDTAMHAFIGALIDEGKIEPDKVLEIAEKAARGKLKETPSIYTTKGGPKK